MAKEIPIPATTGKHLFIPFRVRYKGKPRELITNADTIRFVVTRKDSTAPIISKQTDSGISQDNDGWGQVRLTATDLQRNKFSDTYEYEYDLEIEDGVSGEQWPLAHGPFEIDLSPQ